MLIYATKQTMERYKLKPPEEFTYPLTPFEWQLIESERGDRLLEWGAKLFYFDRRKCIQVVNFASKLTLFLFDIKIADLEGVGDLMAHYMFELYKSDKQMTDALIRMFNIHPIAFFDKLTDKSAIATLNTTQYKFAVDGYRFYDFIKDGILHSREINRIVNFDWLFTMKINGEREYFFAGERFRELVLESYGQAYPPIGKSPFKYGLN